MHPKQKKTLILALAGAAVLVAGAASAYYVGKNEPDETPKQAQATTSTPATRTAQAAPQPVRQQPQPVACDDGNIVGTGIGAVAGGLVGNQIGKGSGNTVATIGGAAGGAMLGQRYLPTRGVTCR